MADIRLQGGNVKKVIAVFAVCLAVLSGILTAELFMVSAANSQNKRELENVYKSAVLSLNDSLDNLEVGMSKIMVARGAGENRELITDVYRHAETAAQGVSVLPLSFENSTAVTKFFNQVGDWCKSFMRAIDDGLDVSAYRDQADEIYDTARVLSEKFREIQAEITEKGAFASIGEDRLFAYDFEQTFADMAHNSVEYPALIYDGPFSDGKSYSFKAIEHLAPISDSDALSIAEEKFGIEEAQVYLTHNKTEVYVVTGKREGGDALVMLTQKGGFPLLFDAYDGALANESGREFSREEREQKAVEYMGKLGIKNLVPVWYNYNDGVAVVNLAPEIDGVVYYTDLVKVKMTRGNVVSGFECSGYCAGSKTVSPSCAVNSSAVIAQISPKITVVNVRLAVIPIGEKQVFCYEVAGRYQGLDYFIYVDALSGKEVNILRVVDNKQGSMTM